ncbi:MAG TPA: acyl-CoA synthetase, partial [Pseudomonas sp.]|nr:acyl-CoA synthetase [Pseudomonas sp.]
PAVIHGSIRRTWAETYMRCRRLASALAGRGIGKGDTVAVMLPNIPSMLEAHFAVPMIGAVLNTLNVRLDAEAIAFMLQHGEARVLIADREFASVVRAAVGMLDHPPLVIDVDDPEYGEG